jgi:hypothetical protein
VVGHQAIAQQRHPEFAGPFGEKGQVNVTVAIAEEDFLAVVSPLRYVVRCADRDHASKA